MKKIIYKVLILLFVLGGLIVLQRKGLFRPAAPEVVISSGTFAQGDSVYSVLDDQGWGTQEISLVINKLSPLYDLRKCQPGDRYEVFSSTSGLFLGFHYYPEDLSTYRVEKSSWAGWRGFQDKPTLNKKIMGMKGKIKSSLYEGVVEQGLDPELAMKFADIFTWQIDFLTEPQPGDTFKIVWERYTLKGKRERKYEGRILSAQYLAGKKEYNAFFFENAKGQTGYYTKEGQSLRKAFLRSPLNYRRISSYFSRRRFHPILKYWRPHHGTDYAAPTGTPVVSVGEGTVIYAGWKGGYGKYVRIRHLQGYLTGYGHFSRIAKGIRTGKKINQGQLVGYVGRTGYATGPHLHFEVIKGGKFFDFLKIKFPSAREVAKTDLERFKQVRDERLTQFNKLTELISLSLP